MILSDISVKRPVFAAVLSLLLILVGLVSFTRLPVRDLPAIEPPVVSVDVTYRGANAQVIENQVTQLIEDRISGIEGVESISSSSRDGRSMITIEFSARRNIDSAANDVRDRVSGVLGQLPEGALPPDIRKVDPDAMSIMWINLMHPEWTRVELTDYANRVLVDRFASIDGVSRVNIAGEAEPSMRVWLSRQKLVAYGMTAADVEAALRRQNVELPAGQIQGVDANLTVRVDRQFKTPEDFRALVVGRGTGGYLVRLGDIARVELGAENPFRDFLSNGEPAIGLGIVRQSGANTLQVANDVKAMMTEVEKTLPTGMQMGVSSDSSLFIDRAITNVWKTLAEAAALVIAVIFIFLGSARATLIPALTVPICLIASFAVLFALGYSINLLTLLAFVLAIGLVVDDAIVVLENIHFRIEHGEPPLLAAFLGTRQVAFAVLASTITVCSVFVPLYFIAGNTGLLFRELAGAMIGAMAFSGFVALSLTPMLCSKMLRKDIGKSAFSQKVDAGFARVQRAYRAALEKAVVRPVLVIGSMVAIVAVCLMLGSFLPSELAPEEDQGDFNANISAAEGTSFDRMVGYMHAINDELLPLVGDGQPIRRVQVRVPGGFGASEDYSTGALSVFLVPWEDRNVTTRDVVNQVQQMLSKNPHLRGNASVGNPLSRRRGRPIQLVIAGSTFEGLAKARDVIFREAAANPGIIDLDSDYKETRPQLLVDIDTVRAGDLGVSISDIGNTLETMMGSKRVTRFLKDGEEYYVMVQAEDEDRAAPDDLTNIYVRSSISGEMVPLSNLVKTRESAQAGELGRFNKQRAITLNGDLGPGTTLGEALDFLEAIALEQPEITAIGYRGESYQLRQTGSSLWFVLGLTIVLVFLILAAQFESFVHPIVIIFTVPLAVGGGLLGLYVMGGTLNLYSQVGVVMLVGLAAKNGILIVEFANQLRDQGVAFADSILEAAERRLRPVLMTSVATVAGAIPLMLASGAGAAARRAIGIVIVWGVSLSAVLTLFLIPVLYSLLARRTSSPETVRRQLEEQMEAASDLPETSERRL